MAKKSKTKPTTEQLPFEIRNAGSKAELKIVGEIGWWSTSGERFTELVDELIAAGIQDSHLYVNSGGGDMINANEIVNQLLRFPGENTVSIGAICASAATRITSIYSRGNISAAPNMQFMIHDPAMNARIEHLEDFESNKKLYENLRNDAINTYHKLTGISKKELSDMLRATTWMNAEEAKAKGFIGKIEGEEDELLPADTASVLNKIGAKVPEVLNSLLDTEEEELEEETPPTPPTHVPNNSNDTMKKEQLIALLGLTTVTANSSDEDVIKAVQARFKAMQDFRTAMVTALGLTVNDQDDTAVLTGITNLVKANKDKVAELQGKIKATEDAKLKAVLDIAQNTEQKITAEQRTKYEGLAPTIGVTAVVEMLELIPSREKLIDGLDGKTGKSPENLTEAVYARLAAMDAEAAGK
ncbi:MAG: ATP-dependent Clp protease proteolytic subunit [Imperialibacter sp.]|uniref:Clp protease ClpP n=1 Tax=Imperialibacter sp. TaxID=2038411 RepID=UPI0032F08187